MSNRLPAPLLHSLLIAALILIIYRPALNYQFVWDDLLYVTQNTAVQSWTHLPAAFTSPKTTWSSDPTHTIAEWRPLRNISYLIDHTLYGLNPTGWHLTNILLHALAAILLYHLIRRLIRHATAHTPTPPSPATITTAALLGALYWALHPLQTEIVAWVKSRDDLLATNFLLAALLTALPLPTANITSVPQHNSQLSTLNSPTPLRIILTTILYICALLSKENTIILAALYPTILVLLNPSPHRPPALSIPQGAQSAQQPQPAKNHSPFSILRSPFSVLRSPLSISIIITAALYLLLRHQILGRTTQSDPLAGTPANTLYTMLAALTKYIQLILWPWPPNHQSADYDAFPIITTPLHPATLTGAAILLALLAILTALLWKTLRQPTPSNSRLTTPSDHRGEATPQFIIHNSSFIIPLPHPLSALSALSLLVFLLPLLPYANIIPMMQILAERFLHLPLIGPALLLSTLLLSLPSLKKSSPQPSTLNSQLSTINPSPSPHTNPRRAATPQFIIHNSSFIIVLLPLLLILALTIQTHHRLPVWQNEITLFTDTLRANPHSWRPHNNLTKAHLKQGQTTAALRTITPALRQFPRDPDIVRTAALVHLLNGHETTGTLLTQYATQLQPNDPRATQTLQQYQKLKATGKLP